MLPLVDLRAQFRTIEDEVMAAIRGVLESGQFVLGPETDAFERELAAHSQAAEAVGTSSGSSALHLALLASGVGPGDEVITVPFTFVATRDAAVSVAELVTSATRERALRSASSAPHAAGARSRRTPTSRSAQ